MAVTPGEPRSLDASRATPPGPGSRATEGWRGGAFFVTFHPSMAAPVGPVKFWRPGKAFSGVPGRCGGLTLVLAPRPASWGLRTCPQASPRRAGHRRLRAGRFCGSGAHSGPEGFGGPLPAWADILCDLVRVSLRASLTSLLMPGLAQPARWRNAKAPTRVLLPPWGYSGTGQAVLLRV